MNTKDLKETFRRFVNHINPWYRNPIVQYNDIDHLKGERRELNNPQVSHQLIRSILANNQHVKDAVQDMYEGLYLIDTAVVGNALLASVYAVEDYDNQESPDPIYNPDWVGDRIPSFLLKQRGTTAELTELQHPLADAYYDSLNPQQCWTIPLTEAQLSSLGLLLLATQP